MRSRIRVVGGAPPPPLGVAPQDPKKPEKFALWRADLDGLRGAEDHAQSGG